MGKRSIWLTTAVCLAVVISVLVWTGLRGPDRFTRLMTRGNACLERGEGTNAMAIYQQAVALAPENVAARLNLANACLQAGEPQSAIHQCGKVLDLDHNSAAAYYLMGCAHLQLNQAEAAVQAFQVCKQIDPAVTALNFQLGLAQERLGHLEDAIAEFQTIVRFEPQHASAHYQLGRLYQRLGRSDEAAQELTKHEQLVAAHPGLPADPAALQRCKYTQPLAPFVAEQPLRHGVSVRFVEATSSAFGNSNRYRGPLAVLDYNHDGRNSLFVREGDRGFRLLSNQKGRFQPLGDLLPGLKGASYRRCLAGDLDNDRFEDIVVLGEQGSHSFQFATNGQATDLTLVSGLSELKAADGLLADLDFTGKLDLLAVLPQAQGLRVLRNLGGFQFRDNTTQSGLPAALAGAEHVLVEDWENDDVPGVLVGRSEAAPLLFAKQRAGRFVLTNSPADWPAGSIIATGDLNNDLRPDLVVAGDSELTVVFGGETRRVRLPAKGLKARGILLLDYDNDGWLDILAFGDGLRLWRNLGNAGFQDVTAAVGLDQVGQADCAVAADFDGDGDTDLIVGTPGGLQFWRNDGGNANRQLKLRLEGNRSNASGLGVRIDVEAGRWHTRRTVQQLPVEIGVGQHEQLDFVRTHWFDLTTTLVETRVPPQPLVLVELSLPTGSCPYLYAWNGQRFCFVTDILGAAPLGLPASETRLLEADPEEYLALGSEAQFPPKAGRFEVRVTEELREVLYLDQAQLVAVDHPLGTVVCPTSKLRPGKPFPPHELWTLRPLGPPRQAFRNDGLDITAALAQTDGVMVSPVRLRQPQLRGLAEPFSITLDFGELPVERPLVLVLTGWLRFGGGMANIAAALDPKLPFPFPTLAAELPNGSWQPVQTDVGAPAGKSKSIVVDLEKKLPLGARRLRITAAFELYWDSALLCEKIASHQNQQSVLTVDLAELRWHGFGRFADLPAWLPLTPEYDAVSFTPPWSRTPAGWCTRYGRVDELIRQRDDALVLLNGGDELALSFPAVNLPSKPPGFVRDFFLHVVGWDKDADFHVAQGWRVEPLPFRGQDDQAYGRLSLAPRPSQSWVNQYNTRWVGPFTVERTKGEY